jgi:hypothetical protein
MLCFQLPHPLCQLQQKCLLVEQITSGQLLVQSMALSFQLTNSCQVNFPLVRVQGSQLHLQALLFRVQLRNLLPEQIFLFDPPCGFFLAPFFQLLHLGIETLDGLLQLLQLGVHRAQVHLSSPDFRNFLSQIANCVLHFRNLCGTRPHPTLQLSDTVQ